MTQPGISIPNAAVFLSRAGGNPLYRKAVESRPGYLEAVALRDRAMQRRQARQFPQVVYPEPPTSIDTDLDEYLTAFTDARAEEEARARDIDALTHVIGACERAINGSVSNTDALLRTLAGDFGDWLTRAKTLDAKLKGAATANEAISFGVAETWRDLTDLRAEYDLLRAAQEQVLVGAYVNISQYRSDHIDDPLASDLIIRDLDEILPAWRDRDPRITLQGAPPDRRPWPHDQLEQIVWLIRHATPWLPTLAQLEQLHRERAQRLNPTPTTDGDIPDGWVRPNTPTKTRRPVVQRIG